jgi:hypothetical protein
MRLAWHSTEPPIRCSECGGWHQRIPIESLPGRFLCLVFSVPAQDVSEQRFKEERT